MPKVVTIRVSVETKERLRALKRHPRESYSEVIERLLDWWEKNHPEMGALRKTHVRRSARREG